MKVEKFSRVISIKHLTSNAYILRFERNDIVFQPGQHIGLGLPSYPFLRDYSIYSSISDNFIEVLIKEIPGGDLSLKLKECTEGSMIKYKDPFGNFVVDKNNTARNYTFFATDTGIAPFHSFIQSYTDLDYYLFHGVRFPEDAYGRSEYDPFKYTLLTSKDPKGQYKQRIPDYLRSFPAKSNGDFYLCGNGKMIYEVNDILLKMGICAENIFFEIYF